MAVDSTIQFKRGKKNELPNGLEGEPLYCTDTNELYIGQGETLAPKLITGGGTTENIQEYMEKVDDLEKNKINLIDDDTSMEGIDDTEFPTLTTKDKRLIGAINEVNAQYKGIVKNFVTPEMFGAKGDGVTDDTTAFKLACSNSSCILLTGKYKITSQCELNNINLISFSKGTIVCSTNDGFTINLKEGCTVDSVIFTGVNCILISGMRNKLYNNVFGKYNSERTGIHIKFNGTAWYGENFIDKNLFIGGGEANIDIRNSTSPATDNYITNNVFAYSTNSIIGSISGTIIAHNHDYSYEGMYLDGANLKIDENYFDNGEHTSISINAKQSLSISNNVFYSTTDKDVDLIVFRRGINCICIGNTVGGYTGNVTLFNLNNFYFKSSFKNNQCGIIAKNISTETLIASHGLDAEITFFFNDEQYTIPQKMRDKKALIAISSTGTFNAGKIGKLNLTGAINDTILSMSCKEGAGLARYYSSTGEIHILYPSSASDILITGAIYY